MAHELQKDALRNVVIKFLEEKFAEFEKLTGVNISDMDVEFTDITSLADTEKKYIMSYCKIQFNDELSFEELDRQIDRSIRAKSGHSVGGIGGNYSGRSGGGDGASGAVISVVGGGGGGGVCSQGNDGKGSELDVDSLDGIDPRIRGKR